MSDKSGLGIVDTLAGSTPIIYSCTHRMTNVVLKFLETPHMCNLSHMCFGRTVAYHAMQNNMGEVVLKLLTYWNECKIYEQTINSSTPLMWACSQKFTEICMRLLKYPEKCRLSDADAHGKSALILACMYKKTNMVRKILKSNIECRPDIQDLNGKTPLIYAVINELDTVVALLLNIPDKCNMGAQDTYGCTALHFACRLRNNSIALKILTHPDKCNMSARNMSKNTALHIACSTKNADIIANILQYPDKCGLGLQDNEGYTPLHMSASRKDIKTCRMMTIPANIGICNLGALNNTGYTLLLSLCSDASMSQDFQDLILDMLDYPDICNLGACTPSNMTALMFAYRHHFKEIALKMLNYPDKCNLNVTHPIFTSVFTMAFNDKQTDIVDKIAQHINIIDHIPLTPEYKIIFSKYIDVCVKKQINDMPNSEEIKKNMEILENYRDMISDDSQIRNCIMCLCETCHNAVFVNCKHVIAICIECTELTCDRCPICSKNTNVILGAFIV